MTVTVTLRAAKGAPLTAAEVDANFADLAAGVNAASGGGSESYTLPAASSVILGGVKVGTGLAIDGGGVMSLSLTSAAVIAALGYTPSAGASGVATFNTRTGAIVLTSSDVTSALGFTPASSASAGGVHGSHQYVAAGTFTYVVPAGVTTVFLTGAGGGGGAYARSIVASTNIPGGRGQVGYRIPVTVTPGESITVLIGSAGASFTNSSTDPVVAGDGGTTSFGSYAHFIAGSGASSTTGAGTSIPPINNLAFFMCNSPAPNQTFYGDNAWYGEFDGGIGYALTPAQPGYLIVEW